MLRIAVILLIPRSLLVVVVAHCRIDDIVVYSSAMFFLRGLSCVHGDVPFIGSC